MKPRSTRLNAENRDRFIARVLKDKMPGSAYPEDERFYKKWNPRIYEEVYGPYTETMDQLPSWFFVEGETMKVRLAMNAEETAHNEVTFNLPNKVKRVNEETGYSYSSRANIIPKLPYEHEACNDWRLLKQAQHDFRVQKEQIRKQIHKLAYSCNTSGQLYKAWDEAVNYSDCFPYKAPSRHQGADISERELDIGFKLAKTSINLPDDMK